MSQINVNGPDHGHTTTDSGDRTAAAGINFLTVLVVLAVVVAILWFLFTGPFRGGFGWGGDRDTNINVNPPAQQQPPNINVNPPNVNVNPPAQPSKP
jgi:hypothetical protein